jgi:hypothetical protein
MTERTVKLIKAIPFSVLHIFDGGTIEDVQNKLLNEYEKLKSNIDDDKFITFGFDSKSNDTFVKIWRLETDKEFNLRKSRIEHLAHARDVRVQRRRDNNDTM